MLYKYVMEHEKFIKFLQEHAELERVRVAANANLRPPKTDNVIWRQGQPIAITKKQNPTQHLRIKKIKHAHRACEDCGKICQDRRTSYRIVFTPKAHWRETCHECHLTRCPYSDKFVLGAGNVNAVFRAFIIEQDK